MQQNKNTSFLLIHHSLYLLIKGNTTLQGEFNEQYKHFCSFDIIYEALTGPGHYLTLVHTIYTANDYVGILE